MKPSEKVKLVYASLRKLHGEIPAGQVLRIAAIIVEAENFDDGYVVDAISRTIEYSHSHPVDQAISDGGWWVLSNDRRSNFCLWSEGADSSDITFEKLRRIIGRIEFPWISRTD